MHKGGRYIDARIQLSRENMISDYNLGFQQLYLLLAREAAVLYLLRTRKSYSCSRREMLMLLCALKGGRIVTSRPLDVAAFRSIAYGNFRDYEIVTNSLIKKVTRVNHVSRCENR